MSDTNSNTNLNSNLNEPKLLTLTESLEGQLNRWFTWLHTTVGTIEDSQVTTDTVNTLKSVIGLIGDYQQLIGSIKKESK